MNGNCLSITSLFLLIPIIIFSFKDIKIIPEIILAFLLTNNIIISFLFWKNPTKNSRLHFYDGIFAKISYILFPIYILFIKNIDYLLKILFIIIFLLSTILFYYSNSHSKKCWCSKKHILCHSIFHILISIGTSFAFI
jgi:hypothetical protein